MSAVSDFYTTLSRSLETEPNVAVATIVRTRGSSPREVGARMLVKPDGATDGTVGGGCGEAEVWRTALEVMADEQPRMVVVDLTADIAMTSDGVCGGVLDIFVEPWHRNGANLAADVLAAVAERRVAATATVVGHSRGLPVELGEKLLIVDGVVKSGGFAWPALQARVLADLPSVIARGDSAWRTYAWDERSQASARPASAGFAPAGSASAQAAVVAGGPVVEPSAAAGRDSAGLAAAGMDSEGLPSAGLASAGPASAGSRAADQPAIAANVVSTSRRDTATAAQVSVFFDLAVPTPTLVVVGAGHVAMPIAQIGKLLDFEVVVVDDRPAFANADRFPDASQIIVDDFATALDNIPITPSTYVVLVTRAHTYDVHALRKIVRQPAGYIGMIGSRRRVYAVFKLLRDEGVPVEDLLRVHAPIGLDIKTETPGEIAISVGAEILKARRGGGAQSMSDLLKPQYRYSLTKGDDDI